MRLDARTMMTALLLAGCATLGACGKKDEGTNTVQMKDLEVVDGTTTDAMTDLDGVQSEVPEPAVPGAAAGNATEAPAKPEAASNAAAADTEILSDQ